MIYRVLHQRRDATPDLFGQLSSTWTDMLTYGTQSVTQLSATEVVSLNRQVGSRILQIDLPYSTNTLMITDEDRFVIDGVNYNISTIDTITFNKQMIRFVVEVQD